MTSDTVLETSAKRRPELTRTRWAAIGAAVAVTLGGGGLGLVHAQTSSPDPMPIYTAIDPCRLADTRPAPKHVGDIAGALAGGVTNTVTVADGNAHGNCTIPAGISSLALNVTALNASQTTFIQFAPGGTLVPAASSSLNPAPGQPPTPNAVTVPLSTAGTFDVYSQAGTVDVIFDVVGYFDDHVHSRVDIVDESGVAYASVTTSNAIGGAPERIAAVDLHAPSSGNVVVTASILVDFTSAGADQIMCTIDDGSGHANTTLLAIVSEPIQAYAQTLEFTRTLPATAGETTYEVLCQTTSGAASATQAFITATYESTWYGDVILGPIITLPPIITLGS